MKKTYVKPEIQVFRISKPMLLAGSGMNASFNDDASSIDDGGDTSSGGIYSID